jgi:SulP family sulfate permease
VGLTLFGGLRYTNRGAALRDGLAGLTLASMNIPQVLGYTRIAGTPVVTGLYTLLLPLVAFAAFGSSRHLVVAADSATAAIFASGLSTMVPAGSAKYMALVGIVALLTALLLLAARVFRLGFLADFLSRTVLVGFLTGVGIQVGIAVLGEMSGLAIEARDTVAQLVEVALRLPQAHAPTLALSLGVLAVILGCRRWLPRVPVPLIVVAAGIAASYGFDFAGRGIAVVGPVPGGLPALVWPDVSWRETIAVLPVAASCFMIIVAQSAATARSFAIRHLERDDIDADLLGLAAANAAAALCGAFVVNGSPTQTAMGERVGARSQIAQLVTAAVVVGVLLFLTPALQFLPRAVLGAIVFTIAVGLVDVAGLRDIRAESPGEFVLATVTAAAVVLVGLDQGLLLAVALSLLRHVRHSYRPHTAVLAPDAAGRWLPVRTAPGVETQPGLIVYRFGADLFYANEGRFADEVRALAAHAPYPVRWFIVDAGAITDLDFSAARSVRALAEELRRAGIGFAFARVSPFLRADMERHGLVAVIGAERIFVTLHEAVAYTGAADRDADERGDDPRAGAKTSNDPDTGHDRP